MAKSELASSLWCREIEYLAKKMHHIKSMATFSHAPVGIQIRAVVNDSKQSEVTPCLFVCLFWIRNRICLTGSTPEGGPTGSSPSTQATRHPPALLLFMSPIPPFLCHASCIRSVPSPVLLSCTDILPSIWSAPSLSSCPTHIFNPPKYEPFKPHVYTVLLCYNLTQIVTLNRSSPLILNFS